MEVGKTTARANLQLIPRERVPASRTCLRLSQDRKEVLPQNRLGYFITIDPHGPPATSHLCLHDGDLVKKGKSDSGWGGCKDE
jgi:hypothetical protein